MAPSFGFSISICALRDVERKVNLGGTTACGALFWLLHHQVRLEGMGNGKIICVEKTVGTEAAPRAYPAQFLEGDGADVKLCEFAADVGLRALPVGRPAAAEARHEARHFVES